MTRQMRQQIEGPNYGPPGPPDTGGPAHAALGGAVLEAAATGTGRVALSLGVGDSGAHASGSVDARDVERWCRAIEMLVDARLHLQPADEVEFRSPMLVVDGLGSIALWRWLAESESTLRLLLAHTPEELIAGDETTVLFLSVAEVRALIALLTSASRAAIAG